MAGQPLKRVKAFGYHGLRDGRRRRAARTDRRSSSGDPHQDSVAVGALPPGDALRVGLAILCALGELCERVGVGPWARPEPSRGAVASRLSIVGAGHNHLQQRPGHPEVTTLRDLPVVTKGASLMRLQPVQGRLIASRCRLSGPPIARLSIDRAPA